MPHVEIRVKEHLDVNWANWLEGFSITHKKNDETVISGEIPDQAAFFGLMTKLRDLGIKLHGIKFGENTQ